MAVYEVNTLNDIVDADDGIFSLREAIQSANQNAGRDQIVFAASIANNGSATLVLKNGELGLNGPVEITGPSTNSLTIDADRRSRIFTLTDEVTISNLRLTAGQSSGGGGAIQSYGTTILIGCTITDSSGASGGGIFSSGTLNVWESLISNNQASANGGAIYSEGTLSIVDSTIAGNTSLLSGGGINFTDSSDYFVVINSTVAGNEAGTQGGGIYSSPGTMVRMANSIVAGNTSASNADKDIFGLLQNEVSFSLIGDANNSGWVNSLRSSIVGIDWRTVLENDGAQPLLKDNGGRSKTIALLPSSPAIDTGYSDLFTDIASRTDQRGVSFSRKSRLGVDMGAFERPTELTSTAITQSSTRYTDGTVTFTVNVNSEQAANRAIGGSVRLDYFGSEDDSRLLNSEVLAVVNGVATKVFSEVDYGVYRVKATYLGDDNFRGSISPSVQRSARLVDYGDAPSASQSGFLKGYPVSFEQDGARHSIANNIYLGRGTTSHEIDGTPSANADSDSQDDGVVSFTPLIVSPTSTTISSFLVVVPANAKLDGWIDFNRDGDWDDVGEKIYDSVNVVSGSNLNSFTIPAGASVGQTGARFRVSSAGGLKPMGAAYDGEVEDYLVTLTSDVGEKLMLSPQQTAMVAEIVTIGGEVVIKGLTKSVIFRAPIDATGRLELDSSAANSSSSWLINNLDLQFTGKLIVEPGPLSDVVRLPGSGQTMKLATRSVVSSDHLYAQLDIRGTGDNTLTVNSALPRTRVLHDRGDKIDGTLLQLVSPEVIDGQFVHRLNHTQSSGRTSSIEIVNQAPLQNPRNAFDADMDGSLSPTDVLSIINMLRRSGSSPIVSPTSLDPLAWRYCDINGDNVSSPLDVLLLINELRRLAIPIPNYGYHGNVRSITISGGSLYGTEIIRETIFVRSGNSLGSNGVGFTSISLATNASGQIVLYLPMKYGSLSVIPERANNPTGIGVSGYKITIGRNLSSSALGSGLK